MARVYLHVLLYLKNVEKNDDNIMFIDASKEFEKVKTQNILKESHVNKIIKTYSDRVVEKYSRPVQLDEIRLNEFNLNIPRYVDSFEEEEKIDLESVAKKVLDIDEKMIEIDKKIKEFCDELEF